MRLSEMEVGHMLPTQLSMRVLAVLVRRVDGWCVYVDAVRGNNHDLEWQEVARSGAKVKREVAEAIARNYFHPGFEIDLEYAT